MYIYHSEIGVICTNLANKLRHHLEGKIVAFMGFSGIILGVSYIYIYGFFIGVTVFWDF